MLTSHQLIYGIFLIISAGEKRNACNEYFHQKPFLASRDSGWIKEFHQSFLAIVSDNKDRGTFQDVQSLIMLQSSCRFGEKPIGLPFRRPFTQEDIHLVTKICPICITRNFDTTTSVEINQRYIQSQTPKPVWHAYQAFNYLSEFPRDSISTRFTNSLLTLEQIDPPKCSYYKPQILAPSSTSWILNINYLGIANAIESQKKIPGHLQKFTKIYLSRGKDCELLALLRKYSIRQ